METTRLSTKGQIVLPKTIRESRAWGPGTEFSIVETPEGLLLRPAQEEEHSKLDDVAGSLRRQGVRRSIKEMREAVSLEMARRRDSGRY